MEIEDVDNANIQKVVFVGLDNAGKSSIILSPQVNLAAELMDCVHRDRADEH